MFFSFPIVSQEILMTEAKIGRGITRSSQRSCKGVARFHSACVPPSSLIIVSITPSVASDIGGPLTAETPRKGEGDKDQTNILSLNHR